MNLQVTTRSGVVRPGQPLLEIVPDETSLIIDARVRPIDIDAVHAGMRTRVVLTAYRQRSLPRTNGEIRSVSADRLTDERNGEGYFLAKIEIDADELSDLETVHLSPGMPAEVMILTGKATVAEYRCWNP